MNKSEIIGKLEVYIEQLQQNLEIIKFSTGRISKPNMDYTLQAARSVHEWVMLLHYFNSHTPPSSFGSTPTPEQVPVSTEAVHGVVTPPDTNTAPPEITNKTGEVPAATAPSPAEITPIIQAQQFDEALPPSPQPGAQATNTPPSAPPPSPRPSIEVQVSINDRKSESVTERLADRLQSSKIEDLKKAVPLHEKFQYINELFKGENIPYNEFITLVNTAEDYTHATQICNQYASRFKWNRDSKTYFKLQELIQRRFT